VSRDAVVLALRIVAVVALCAACVRGWYEQVHEDRDARRKAKLLQRLSRL
jgi:hypothetical protein